MLRVYKNVIFMAHLSVILGILVNDNKIYLLSVGFGILVLFTSKEIAKDWKIKEKLELLMSPHKEPVKVKKQVKIKQKREVLILREDEEEALKDVRNFISNLKDENFSDFEKITFINDIKIKH